MKMRMTKTSPPLLELIPPPLMVVTRNRLANTPDTYYNPIPTHCESLDMEPHG